MTGALPNIILGTGVNGAKRPCARPITLLLVAIAVLTLSILLRSDWPPHALDTAKVALATAVAVVAVWVAVDGGRALADRWRRFNSRPLLMACWLSVDTKQIEVRPTKVHTMAKARALIGAASFDPDTLKMIGQAFDDAWARVAQSYTSPSATEAARLKLANIVLSLVADGVRDPARLSDRAFRIFALGDPHK